MNDVMVGPMRLFWSDLAKPDDYGKYSVKVGFSKTGTTPGIDKLKQILKTQCPPGGSMPNFEDGDLSDYDGNAGYWLFRAKTGQDPICYDSNGAPLAPEKFHTGCDVRVMIHVYDYDNKFGKGVGLGLEWVQWAGAGSRRAAAPPPAIEGVTPLSQGGGAVMPSGPSSTSAIVDEVDPRTRSASAEAMSQDEDLPF